MVDGNVRSNYLIMLIEFCLRIVQDPLPLSECAWLERILYKYKQVMFHILKLAERDELFGEAAFFVLFEV